MALLCYSKINLDALSHEEVKNSTPDNLEDLVKNKIIFIHFAKEQCGIMD